MYKHLVKCLLADFEVLHVLDQQIDFGMFECVIIVTKRIDYDSIRLAYNNVDIGTAKSANKTQFQRRAMRYNTTRLNANKKKDI